MKKIEIKVNNPKGLHGRPTGMVVHYAKKFTSNIFLEKDGKSADAKSIVSIMSLGVTSPASIMLAAEGADEAAAVDAMKEMIESIYIEA